MTDKPTGGTTATDIIAIVEHNPVVVLVDKTKRDALLAHIEKEVAEFTADVSTAKGREECRSFAAKITRTKTTVDKSRLALTEEAREKIKSVNAEGAVIEDRLKTLAAQARQPLTEWEEAEEARQTKCKAILDELRATAVIPMGATSEMLRDRIGEVEREDMSEELWGPMHELATKARDTALDALKAALALVEQKEAEAAELAKLRAEAEERDRAEEKKRQRNEYIDSIIQHITDCGLGMIGGQPQPYGILLRELEEKVPPEIETFGERKDEVERHRLATLERIKEAMNRQQERAAAKESEAAEVERQRQEQEAAVKEERERELQVSAAERAREQERELQREQAETAAAEQQRAHEAELAAERERTAAAEERERARVAAEQAAAAERARLEADQARRRQVKAEAKDAIISCGADEETAKKIVLAIIAGEIPRVALDFSAEPPGVKKADPKPEGALL